MIQVGSCGKEKSRECQLNYSTIEATPTSARLERPPLVVVAERATSNTHIIEQEPLILASRIALLSDDSATAEQPSQPPTAPRALTRPKRTCGQGKPCEWRPKSWPQHAYQLW